MVEGGASCDAELEAAAQALRAAAVALAHASSGGAVANTSTLAADQRAALERLDSVEFLVSFQTWMLVVQTFILIYCFLWMHFPRFMDNQIDVMTSTAVKLTCGLFRSPELLQETITLTQVMSTHPENLRSVCSGMRAVFTSPEFMATSKECLKQVLLDKEIQRLVGICMSGVSRVALKNTFSRNPGEDDEQPDGSSGGKKSEPERGEPPLVLWLRGIQQAWEKQRREGQERRALDDAKEKEKGAAADAAKNDTPPRATPPRRPASRSASEEDLRRSSPGLMDEELAAFDGQSPGKATPRASRLRPVAMPDSRRPTLSGDEPT